MSGELEQVATAEDLTAQLRRLFDRSGKSYERLAAESGVGTSTLHELVNKPGSFPRRDTLREFVRACGQEEGPWMSAWARVERARSRPARTPAQDLREEVEELRRELELARRQVFEAEVAREAGRQVAEQRIRELTAELAKAREEATGRRRELNHDADVRAAARALASVGQPTFRPAPTDSQSGGRGYSVHSVRHLMDRLRAAAAQGTAALAQALTLSSLEHQFGPRTNTAGYSPDAYDAGYIAEDVDDYLEAVRQAVRNALR